MSRARNTVSDRPSEEPLASVASPGVLLSGIDEAAVAAPRAIPSARAWHTKPIKIGKVAEAGDNGLNASLGRLP